ncbi:MAG TPA: hypothetical protein VGS41_00935 [Chthonomonadales bacterium]|nr:hypothetical protein [Chthonomonadales bacterium]
MSHRPDALIVRDAGLISAFLAALKRADTWRYPTMNDGIGNAALEIDLKPCGGRRTRPLELPLTLGNTAGEFGMRFQAVAEALPMVQADQNRALLRRLAGRILWIDVDGDRITKPREVAAAVVALQEAGESICCFNNPSVFAAVNMHLRDGGVATMHIVYPRGPHLLIANMRGPLRRWYAAALARWNYRNV